MTIQAEIIDVFKSYELHEFDPVDCFQKISDLLEEACKRGRECDPRNDILKAQYACNAYGRASTLFLKYNQTSYATKLLINAWNLFSEIQVTQKKRIYRAGLAMYLTNAYLYLDDKGAAFRWALLTHADDLLGKQDGGKGKQTLQAVLDMSDQSLKELKNLAFRNLEKIEENDNDWSMNFAFAEDVITKFAYSKSQYAPLFAMPTQANEYPINPTYFTELLRLINAEAPSTTIKGDRLEDLATYLFLLIPGFSPRRNPKDIYTKIETDIVVREYTTTSNLRSELFGRHFLVECKNWEKPIRVAEVGYFLYRIRLAHANFGIIFSKKSITGQQDKGYATNLLSKAFHEDQTLCVIIDEQDLVRLEKGESTFWSLLLEKLEIQRFGKA